MHESLRHAFARTVFTATAGLAATQAAAAGPQVITACGILNQPGSYVLGNNLASPADCILVATDFVTIDLGGFVISGSGKGAAVTELRGNAYRGTTVRNGVIVGFLQGVQLAHSTGTTIENIHSTGNVAEGIVVGDLATVRDSRTIANGSTGISTGQRPLVTGNNSNDNGGHGIGTSSGAQVGNNNASHNKGSGISTTEGSNVVHNTARNNSSHGIFVDCPSAVVGNAATNNLAQNIYLLNGACESGHNSEL
jgi:hypothetical protein